MAHVSFHVRLPCRRCGGNPCCDAILQGMLTVLIECRDNEAELAHTLSALVAGAVEGLVREVVVLDFGSRDGSARVADAAGCRFRTEWDLKEVVLSARGDWLLLLEPGARPLAGWVEAVADHIAMEKQPAHFAAARGRLTFFRRFIRRPALERGYLVSKPQALVCVRSGMALADMVQSGRARRLAAGIVPA